MLVEFLSARLALEHLDASIDQAAHPYDVCILFLAFMMAGRVHEAFSLLTDVTVSLWRLLPGDALSSSFSLPSRANSSACYDSIDAHSDDDGIAHRLQTGRQLARRVAALQLVVSQLDRAAQLPHASSCSNSIAGESSSAVASLLEQRLLASCQEFVLRYRIFLPLAAFAIRTSLLLLALQQQRQDVVYHVLTTSYPANYESYATLLTTAQLASHQMQAKQDKEEKRGAAGDEGYRYLQLLSREECQELLKVQSVGSFMVRHQDASSANTSSQQLLLSFRSSGPEGVKHAVIRRDVVDQQYRYRCGAVGPLDSLMALLR